MSSILVTGGSGLLGSNVISQLLVQNNQDFVILVRTEEQAKIWNSFGIQTITGDLENPTFDLPSSIKTIIHTAAIAGDWVDKKKAQTVNIFGTEYLLQQAEKIGCTKFIFVSTIGVYGHVPYHNASEDRKYKNSTEYEKSKIEAEKRILEYNKAKNNLKIVIVRPSSMYGPGDRYIIPTYIKYLKKGRMILIGGGKSLYPIMHAEDTARFLVQLIKSEIPTNGVVERYNLCDDSKITQKEFITIIKDKLGLQNELRSIPYVPAYFASLFFELQGKIKKKQPFIFRKRLKYLSVTRNVSIDKARKELNFEPRWLPKDGIPNVIDTLQEEEEYKSQIPETKIINGIPEKDILAHVPYFLYKILKEKNNL
jgi:nucleoside-diphosphate-sugar epimerase